MRLRQMAWAKAMGTSALSADIALYTKFKFVYTATVAKFEQYYAPHYGGTSRLTQPALPLLKAARAFDPSKVPYLDSPVTNLQSVPGFNKVSEIEFKIFEQQCREVTVTQTGLIAYWKKNLLMSASPSSPAVPPGSVHAERLFSARGKILTPQRLAISQENRSGLTFL